MQSPLMAPVNGNINKLGYVVFVLFGFYYILTGNINMAVTFIGIAFIFDPFNLLVPFYQRPFYQQAVLYAHLLLAFVLISITFLGANNHHLFGIKHHHHVSFIVKLCIEGLNVQIGI